MAGWKPTYEVIELSTGADWIYERDNESGPFPSGTTARVEWKSGQTWDGEVSGNTVSWRIESGQADLIANETSHTMWIQYPNGNTGTEDDYPWKIGRARRTETVRN